MQRNGILLMAAGLSRRYRLATGEHKLRACLPGTSQTIFQATLAIACSVAMPVQVVLRPEDKTLAQQAAAYRCGITRFDSPGLGSSIAAGVAATRTWTGWLIMLADMPWLQPQTLSAVNTQLGEACSARPQYGGRCGHPVGFRAELLPGLLALRGDDGAKSLLQRYPPALVKVTDDGCLRDIDRPEHLLLNNGLPGN